MTGRICTWCDRTFEPGGRGSPQVFCSAICRRAFDQAARDWVREAIAAGRLSMADLREASRKARALVLGGSGLGAATSGRAPDQGLAGSAASAVEGQDDDARFV